MMTIITIITNTTGNVQYPDIILSALQTWLRFILQVAWRGSYNYLSYTVMEVKEYNKET